jgi:S-layer protein (TIGR01567 family)
MSILIILVAFATVAAANPVIHNVTLNTSAPNPHSAILVSVNASNATGVTANSTSLSPVGGITWEGIITAGSVGTHHVNVSAINGSNVTWDDSTSYTSTDTILPVVNSVELNNTTPNQGDLILVTVDATDDVGVESVYAGSTLLTNESGIWNGTITAEAAGTYYVNVSARDGAGNVGWNNSTSYASTTTSPTIPPDIDNVENTTTSSSATITWTTNKDSDSRVKYGVEKGDYTKEEHDATNKTDHSITLKQLKADTTYYFRVNSTDESGNSSESEEYEFKTKAEGHETGYRVWQEGMDTTYTWTAESFTGFYYDLDTGEGTEKLTIRGIGLDGGTIDKGNITYETTAIDVDFEYSKWDSYKVIGFMAEKYFAGYEKGNVSEDITDKDIKLVARDMLSKVLIDEDEDHTISTGSTLELEEGYELKILQLDINGDLAQFELSKNGKRVDTDFVKSGETYVHPIIAVHIGSIFSGTETDMVEIDGIFQISDDYESVKDGTDYDEMEIRSTKDFTIKMENSDDITLEEGELIDLMGDIKLLVADADTLRFALYEEITEPGTYDIRGTVHEIDDATPIEWNPMNFEGFYYDIDTDRGEETLTIEGMSSGGTIDEGDLVYRTEPQWVEFDYNDWGSYQLIGFMAELYFAGYGDGTDETSEEITDDTISLISREMLSKVLLDVDDDRTVSTGASLELVEGYELKILQLDINGDLAQFELSKNGKRVDTDFVKSGETYVHDADDNYGEMEVRVSSEDKIIMKNSDSVTLEDDETIMVMGNVGFKVSEGGDRYYPFVRRTVGSIAALNIELPESLIVDEEIVITITADDSPVEGAEVRFAGENLGLTDSSGEIGFTSEEAGTFTITASKNNYDSASDEIRILRSIPVRMW